MSRAVARDEPTAMEQMGPLVGAGLGTAAVVLGAQRMDLQPDKAAIVVGTLGYVMAQTNTGFVRQLGNGIAAAGVCIAMREYLRQWEPKPEPVGAGVTRADMLKAIDDAMAAERKAHAEEVAALREQVKKLQAELPAARGDKPASKRNEAPKRQTERPAAPIVTGEQGAKFDAVLARFTDEERAAVLGIYNSLSPETARRTQKVLLDMSVDDAVAFVRDNVLVAHRRA